MSNQTSRDELIARIRERVARDWAHMAVQFTEAAAAQLGLNASDLRYLNVLVREGPMTAGKLAEATGLTTGAITGVVDRLEEAGFVVREQDPQDRRRVIVRVNFARMPEAGRVFAPSQQAWSQMLSRYTDAELKFIVEFLSESTRILQEETARLRSAGERPATGRRGRRKA